MLISLINIQTKNKKEKQTDVFIDAFQCGYLNVINNLKKMFEFPKIADILSEQFEPVAESYEEFFWFF